MKVVVVIESCPCTTPVSESEWTELHEKFPKLTWCRVCKQDDYNPLYNCAGWALGSTCQFFWESKMDTNGDFLVSPAEATSYFNLWAVPPGTIAYYGLSTTVLEHVARISGGPGSSCLATSKLTDWIRIAHALQELEGLTYGILVGKN